MNGGIALAPLYTEIRANIEGFKRDMEKAKSYGVAAAKNMSEKLSETANIGKKLTSVGKTMTKYVTLPIVAAGTASTKFAMDFADSVAKVSTIADTGKVPIENLKSGILDLSNKTGKAATELAEGLYQAISASVDTADAVGFLEVATKASIGGFTDAETAVDGLTSILNTYGIEASKADVIANQMLVTQNKGKTTFGELASSMSDVAPIASQLNVSTEELFSSLATTTAQGLQTSKSVTGLKAAFSNIIKPTDEAKNAAKALGIEFNVSSIEAKGWGNFLAEMRQKLSNASPAFAELSDKVSSTSKRMAELEKAGKTNTDEYKNLKKSVKDYNKELELLAEASDSDVSAMAKLFGSVEGLNAMLMLTSEQGMNMYNETMQEMKTNTNALDEAYETMMNTPGKKMEVAMNNLKLAGIKIGDALLPIIEKVAGMLSKLAEKIQNLSPAQVDVIVKIGALVAAIGPLLSVIGKGLILFSKIVPVFTKISVVIAKAGGAAALFGKAVAVISGPVGWAVGGVAALTAGGIALYKHFKQEVIPEVDLFKSTTGEMGVTISEQTKTAVGAYMQMDDEVTKSLYSMRINNEVVTNEIAGNMVSKFQSMGEQVKTAMKENAEKTINLLSQTFNAGDGVIDGYEQGIIDKVKKHGEEQQKQVDFYTQQINDIYKKAAEEHRATTDEENAKINMLQGEMRNVALTELSATEEEAAVIRQRMNDYQNRLSAELASEMLTTAAQKRDGEIKAANETYEGVIREAAKLKNAGAINEEEYKSMIQKAQENRDAQILKANEAYNGVAEEIQNATPGIEKAVNMQTGAMLTKWDQFKIKLKEIWSNITSQTQRAVEAVCGWINEKMSNAIQALQNSWNGFKNWLGTWFNKIISSIKNWLGNIVSSIKQKANDMCNAGKQIFNRLWDGIKGVWSSITGWFKSVASDPVGTIKGIANDMWNAGFNIMSNLWLGLKSLWGRISGWVAEKSREITSKLNPKNWFSGGGGGSPHYNGLSYVPFDGYNARLHKGERVLTAEENRQYTQNNNRRGGDTYNFYSNKAIDEREAARQLRRVNRIRGALS